MQEFLSAFQRGNADFRYIRAASKCLASTIGGNCSQISHQAIEKCITSDILIQARTRSTDRSDPLVRRILAALSPFNPMALIEIVSGTVDEEDRRARPRFGRTVELLTILVSIFEIIAFTAYFLGLLAHVPP